MLKNNLETAASSYLKTAADQPVHWQEWSDELFKTAEELNRPILLDIGAVWCHWCHVMDRESYDDENIADYINNNFVAVKVDRDERPDVDRRYQALVQAISGSGGWPLTCFLTPEGKLIFGGTYFPPDDRMGRPGLMKVLKSVSDAYKNDRERILESAEEVFRKFSDYENSKLKSGKLQTSIIDSAVNDLISGFDPVYGGFGEHQKFPSAPAMDLLLTLYTATGNTKLLQIAETTLENMRTGGVYDHVGGGFHRYSVDKYWQVPHFEKMSFDNAELLKNYIFLYRVTGDERYRETVIGILDWYKRDMTDIENGGFFAHQDADVTLEDDGDYFTWTLQEIVEVLDDSEADIIIKHYGISESPGDLHGVPDRNVMYTVRKLPSIAEELNISVEEAEQKVESALLKLRTARYKRKAPFIDTTLYANLNGMMISAYVDVFKLTDDPEIKDFAVKTTDRIINHMYDEKDGFAHLFTDENIQGTGLLTDQVWMLQALLDMYEITVNPDYFRYAEKTADIIMNQYQDKESGGFFDRTEQDDASAVMGIRFKPVEDIPTSSLNAIAARSLMRLYSLSGSDSYRESAQKTLEAFAGTLDGSGLYMSAYALTLYHFLHEPPVTVITGDPEADDAKGLYEAALETLRPGNSVFFVERNKTENAALPDSIKHKLQHSGSDQAVAFVCRGNECAPPVCDPDELKEVILKF